jgi:hypothetical protein
LITPDGRIKTEPLQVLETHSLPRNNVSVTQWLVQWANLPPDDASWEDSNFIKTIFPAFYASTIQAWFPNTSSVVSRGKHYHNASVKIDGADWPRRSNG